MEAKNLTKISKHKKRISPNNTIAATDCEGKAPL